jgi:hypothetical protein
MEFKGSGSVTEACHRTVLLTIFLQNAILENLRGIFMASKDKRQPEKRDEPIKSEILHRFKTHPLLFIGTVIVLVIVIIAFVFVPAIVPSAQARGELTFGYYNRVPISYVMNNYFYQAQQVLTQRQQPAQDDPNYIYTISQIWRQAFEETVVHMGILDEMKQAGYVVPVDVVDREMAQLPHFQENGRFSATKYRAMDNNSRMNLWRQVQDSVAVNYYLSDLMSLKASSKEVSFVGSMGSPRRSFDLAIFPISSYPDSELASCVEANPALFRIFRLSRITVNSNEREARQILNSIKDGTTTFEEAARASSQDWAADRGGDLGQMMAFDLIYEISDEKTRESVINLASGEISDVIKVQSGWAFYRIDEAARQVDANDPSHGTRIRTYVMSNLRGQAEDWLISEVDKFSALAKENGFDAAVSEWEITKKSFGPIPLNFGNTALFSSISSAGVPELANAGSNEFFWRAAFSTPLNSVSRPLVIGDNVIVLLPLEEIAEEDNSSSYIESYYPYWIGSSTESTYRSYFLNNDKLDDRFLDTFWKLWRGN